jgi:eukaryotic-like serine/threonine-protein kinase
MAFGKEQDRSPVVSLMFAKIQPRSQMMPSEQQNRLLEESNPSPWFSTGVASVVGTSSTPISTKSSIQPIQVSDLPSSAGAVLESIASETRAQSAMLLPGTRFGSFRLIRLLGRGGQGAVWKARRPEPSLDIVALKVLSPALARQPHRLARFRREAERGARLVGPSLLQVFEFGEIDGFPYMAMPFVDGTTLQQVIKGRQAYRKGKSVDLVRPLIAMDEEHYLPTAVRIMSKVARALGLVHACHVAHRDVKPANILLDAHHTCGVYLCDLGVGRDLEFATREQMRDGAGTPMYMAPERLLKAPANEILCDLYSLGVTLFETLTLSRPFDDPGNLPLACLSAKLASAVPKELRKVKPGLPDELEAIILKAMSRNPRSRHQSAQEIADELDEFLARR